MSAHATPHPPRRGRRPRTYGAVLEATAALLQGTALADLSVAQILAAAGVGRTSFYEHFSSKDDVVVKLMESLSDEVAAELTPMFERGERSPDEAFALGLGNLVHAASRYAPLVVAVSEEWPAIPELKAIWFGMLGDFTARLARLIEDDRAAGVAPAGADAQALAASLVWTAERAFHVTATGEDPTLRDPQALVEPLVQLFVGTIYGRAVRAELAPCTSHATLVSEGVCVVKPESGPQSTRSPDGHRVAQSLRRRRRRRRRRAPGWRCRRRRTRRWRRPTPATPARPNAAPTPRGRRSA